MATKATNHNSLSRSLIEEFGLQTKKLSDKIDQSSHQHLQKLADRLCIARNTLYEIRAGEASVTPCIALSLAEAFHTTPQLWLNLQQPYDLWIEESCHEKIGPIVKDGAFLSIKQNLGILRTHATA